jgi:hypothetical protein
MLALVMLLALAAPDPCAGGFERIVLAQGKGAALVMGYGDIYICRPGGRPRLVEEIGGEGDVDAARVAGGWAAFGSRTCLRTSDGCDGNDVVLVNVRRPADAIHVYRPQGFVVHDMELRPNGALAWTTVGAVWRRTSRGRFQRLDAGPGIDAGSLDRIGTTIYWTNAGVRRSASLV